MEAIDLAAHAGLFLDEWQQTCLIEMAALQARKYENPLLRPDGTIRDPRDPDDHGRLDNMWAAKDFGLVVSRQNGKGSILEARTLAGLFLWGERLIIHSAHLFDTALEAFNRVLFLIEQTPDLRSEVARVVNNNGKEGIHLKSGQRLLFKARSKGGVRGFTADTIIFDEAMMKLTSAEMEAIGPAVSARPNPQMIFTGSAGDEDAEYFGRMRNRAMKSEAAEEGSPLKEKFLCWVEWSARPCDTFCAPDCDLGHDDPKDRKTWAKVNPAYGKRLDPEWIEEFEFRAFSPPSFNKERLGVGTWPADGDAWRIIPQEFFNSAAKDDSLLVGKFLLALDTAMDSSMSCISAFGQNRDGMFHSEITGSDEEIDYRPGIRWTIDRLVKMAKTHRVPFVVISKSSPAGAYIGEIESRGVKVISPTVSEFAQACADYKRAIAPPGGERPSVVHLDQAPFRSAVAAADKKEMGDQGLWVLSKPLSGADITPFTSTVLGFWGYKQHIYKKKAKPWVAFG